jgi:1-phosphofructokinase
VDAAPHVIKPNLHELETLVGSQLSEHRAIVAAARSLLEKGIELAAVSMGARGALFITGEQVIAALPPDVKVQSTVGAGDAMVAGILAGLMGGLSLSQTARLASAFSLDALTGKESALILRARINELMHGIVVRECDGGS